MFYILIIKICTANIELFFEFQKKYELFYISSYVRGQLNLRPLIPRALGAPIFRELYFTHTREARARVHIRSPKSAVATRQL